MEHKRAFFQILEDKSQHSEFLDVINNFDFVILVKLGPVGMLLK